MSNNTTNSTAIGVELNGPSTVRMTSAIAAYQFGPPTNYRGLISKIVFIDGENVGVVTTLGNTVTVRRSEMRPVMRKSGHPYFAKLSPTTPNEPKAKSAKRTIRITNDEIEALLE